MKKAFFILSFIFFTIGFANAEIVSGTIHFDNSSFLEPRDSIQLIVSEERELVSDSLQKVDTIQTKKVTSKTFKPNSERSLWLGAIIPGFGQIVNRKYWKLPIVYGGFVGFYYAISWNNRQYQTYKNAYRDILDNDPTTNSHIDILPRGYTLKNFPGGEETYKARLKTSYSQFRQYRDLSIILSVVYYGLVLLDAYVDAELYDFDISPDLVMNIQPTQIQLHESSYGKKNVFGVQCSIRF